jgi:predicted dehydrogenase
MIRLAVVGGGHWGANYLRIFHWMEGVETGYICDQDPGVLAKAKKQFPSLQTTSNISTVLQDSTIQAVVIATPASTHEALLTTCLQAGKHVLVEKPLALNIPDAERVVRLAQATKRVLMVGHTFLYNSAVRKMKELIQKGALGKIYYLHATRTHLGLIRSDVSALWDLAPHDVSIFSYLLDQEPRKVSAVGTACLKDGLHDVAFINLFYGDGVIGNIHLSWVDSNKLRQVAVVGSKARVLFEDLNTLERRVSSSFSFATAISSVRKWMRRNLSGTSAWSLLIASERGKRPWRTGQTGLGSYELYAPCRNPLSGKESLF